MESCNSKKRSAPTPMEQPFTKSQRTSSLSMAECSRRRSWPFSSSAPSTFSTALPSARSLSKTIEKTVVQQLEARSLSIGDAISYLVFLKDHVSTIGSNAAARLAKSILRLTKVHPTDLNLHLHACELVLSLLKTGHDALEECFDQIGEMALDSMKTHPLSQALHHTCLQTLKLIVIHTSIDMSTLTASVFQSAKTFQDVSIQRVIATILHFISETKEGQASIIERDGFNFLMQMMRAYPGDISILCNASGALCWLVHSGDQTLEPGQAEMVQEAMHRHKELSPVFGNCLCLMTASQNDISALVLEGMTKHLDSIQVQEVCLFWLREHTLSVETRHDFLPRIISALRYYESSVNQRRHLLRLACDVFITWTDSESFRRALLENNIFDLLKDLKTISFVWLMGLLQDSSPACQAFGGTFANLTMIAEEMGIKTDS